MAERIPASTQTHQRLTELWARGVADGDARAELIKLAVRKIVALRRLAAEIPEPMIEAALSQRGKHVSTA